MIKFDRKQVLEESEDPLTLEEKMHLVIREQASSLKSAHAVFGVLALLLGLIALGSYGNWNYFDGELTPEIIAEMEKNTGNITYLSLAVFAALAGFYFLVRITSKGEIKKYNELIDGFIRKSYLINFETAVPSGSTRVEKLFNEAVKVFPELKDTVKHAEKKGKELDSIENFESGDVVYDLRVKTKSDQFFLVKFLEEETYDELKNIVKNTENKFEEDKVFRLICVGTDFQNVFQDYDWIERVNSLSRSFKLDLIQEGPKGYSMVWID